MEVPKPVEGVFVVPKPPNKLGAEVVAVVPKPPKLPKPPIVLVVAGALKAPNPVDDTGVVPNVPPDPNPKVVPGVLKVLVLVEADPKPDCAGVPKPAAVPNPVVCGAGVPNNDEAVVAGVLPNPKD